MYKPFTDDFLSIVGDSGICEEYYRICFAHQTDPVERIKINARDVLAAAAGKIPLTKVKDPAIMYELGNLPPNTELAFVLKSSGDVDALFSVQFKGEMQSGGFASLCNRTLNAKGLPAPTPPFIKPVYASIEELIVVFQELSALMRTLIELCDRS